MLNITTFLDANATRLDKPVYYSPERNVRYNSRDILGIISEIGRILKDQGIKKNDCVLIYLPNTPEYLFSFLAIWRIGAIALPTNRIYTTAELNYFIHDTDAKLVITDEANDDLDTDYYIIDNMDKYVDSEILPAAETNWDDVCQLQYTSGTTGKPKGAMLTHGNWFSAIQNECDVLGIKQDHVCLIIYPMAHVGISWAIAALRSAALCITLESYDFDKYLDVIFENKVTHASGMPPVVHSILTNGDKVGNKLYTVKSMICGGGPLHRDIWKKFYKKYGIAILNAYGLSESIVIGTGTVIRPEDYAFADRFESVGHPVCFSEVKIVDPHNSDKQLENEEQGEIALRGPSIAKGYWDMPEATKEVFLNDGWFLTGDIGYIDEDNRLFITDRKKDMIVMSGWKIYPTEVEEVLIRYDKVSEIALFSVPDEHRGEIPVAAVIWNGEEDVEGLLIYAREYLARYKIPRKIFSVDELPRVNGWKLLRRVLREKYSE